MKILFYNHTGQVSGAERMLLMILTRLDRGCFDPLVVCPEEGSLKKMVKALATPVEPVASLQARFTWRVDHLAGYLKSFFQVMCQFRQKVIAIKPDLIHANSIRAGLVATAATLGLGTRIVWHLHDMLPRHPLSIAIRLTAATTKRTRMIAVSQAVADNFVGSFSSVRQRTSVILNAIELEKLRLSETARQKIRDDLALPKAEPLIGIVGQLTPRKGQLELIRAFAEVTKEIPGASLLIVGAALFNRDSDYADLLKRTALELGIAERVRMCGARNDIPEVMQALDLLVVNSKVEPFGLVALEGMACGVPVLSTASGGTAELIEHDQNGWLIPVGDERALAAAIVKLMADPDRRLRLAKRGKQDVWQRFAAHRYVADLISLYRRNGDSVVASPDKKQTGGVTKVATSS